MPNQSTIIKICISYLLIWILAPAIINTSVALDVSEGINWGSEWQWGYYKHPPFSSWVLYSFYALFGHSGPYLLSQLCVIASLICTYQIGRLVWSKEVGFLGSALTMAIFYYTSPTLEFNHNVAQFPIWSGLSLTFYLAITKGRWSHWVWLGILGGVGMLIKYSVFFLLLPMAIFLAMPRQWSLLKTIKPWVSAIVMLAIFAPHFYWLVTHDWITLSYAQGRGHVDGFMKAHFNWLGFIGAQFVAHIPLVIISLLQIKNFSSFKTYRQTLGDTHRIVWFMWFAPLVVMASLSLLFGINLRDMWGMPMWGLSGLLVASMIVPERLPNLLPRMLKGVGIWLGVATLLMLVYISFAHKIRHRPSRMDWNEQMLTQQATKTWTQHSTCPLDSLSGDSWLSALVAMNIGFPSQLFEGSPNKTPWMSVERLQKYGTLIIWQAKKSVPELPLIKRLNQNNFVRIEGQWSIPWSKKTTAEPLLVKWVAYIPNSCTK